MAIDVVAACGVVKEADVAIGIGEHDSTVIKRGGQAG